MKLNKYFIMLGLAASTVCLTTACDDQDKEITEIEYSRLFSPLDLEARVQNQIEVRLNWKAVSGATSYTVNVYTAADQEGEDGEASDKTKFVYVPDGATPVQTISDIEKLPIVIKDLAGQTRYIFEVIAVGKKGVSKGSCIDAKTGTEQTFRNVGDADVEATSVVLTWNAADAAGCTIKLTPGNIEHKITAEEGAAKSATITGLTGETEYTAKMFSADGKQRGLITFKTGIDVGDAIKVNPGDDLKAVLDAMEDGQSVALFGGEYTIGTYETTKSIEIFSAKASDKATITGTFKIAAAIKTIKLTNLNIVSTTAEGNSNNLLAVSGASSAVETVVIDGCTIDKPKGSIIYDNSGATWGDININNCIFQNIGADGDGFDFRKGNLANLTVTNTTFMNGGRSLSRIATAKTVVKFENVTLSNICTPDDGNNRGLFALEKADQKLIVNNLLIVGVGPQGGEIQNAGAGTWAKADKYKCAQEIQKVYYWSCPNLWGGACKDEHSFATEKNPGYKDGSLVPTDEDIIYVKAGDPRWYN